MRLQAVLRYDVSLRWSARARAAVRAPLGVMISAMLVAMLCGFVIHPRVFVLAGGLLAVIVVGLSWPWLVLRTVQAEWQPPADRITEGDPTSLRLAVRNPLVIPVYGLGLRYEESSIALGRVAARRITCCEWSWTPSCHGLYPRTLALETAVPFGLLTARRSIPVPQPMIVWPRVLPVGPMPADAHRETCDGHVARPRVGMVGDLLGVRPFRRGDSPRRIHWPQSARHDRLIVCELQSTARPRIVIEVDLRPGVHDRQSRAWAIRVAASFASGWLAEGGMIGLRVGTARIHPASGGAQRIKILDALAAAEDSANEPAAIQDALSIVITSDAHVERSPHTLNVIIHRAGEKSPIAGGAWLDIPLMESLPWMLRHGWAEARHGG
jgi:uncharacterized protein (DUF58 family)